MNEEKLKELFKNAEYFKSLKKLPKFNGEILKQLLKSCLPVNVDDTNGDVIVKLDD